MQGQQCWELLRPRWQWCVNGYNNCQQCWDLQCIVGRMQPIRLWRPCVMRVRGPNNVGRAVQIIVALRFGDHGTNKCWELLVWPVSNFGQQQLPTTRNRVCKQTLHVTSNDAVSCWPAIGSLSNNDGDGNENGKKLANQQLFTCIMLFCTFLCRSCTTTTWNCLTLIQFSRIQLPKIRQHLAKWTRQNKRD